MGKTRALSPLDQEAVRRGVRRLPSLPAVVLELLHSIDDEGADVASLAMSLARDQALAAKVLRVANSSYYGLPGRVRTIGDAFVLLGLQGVRTLAMGAVMVDVSLFRGGPEVPGWDFNMFWRHSFAVGLVANSIAQRIHCHEGPAFAAGLLHDIGRLALATCFPQHLSAVLGARSSEDPSWQAVEQRVLGIDHAAIGRLLAEHWRFPPSLSEAIGLHHAPDSGKRDLAGLIRLANLLGHVVERAQRGDEDMATTLADTRGWSEYGLSLNDCGNIVVSVSTQLEAASAAFI